MIPCESKEANVLYGPPPGFDEAQVASIPACRYEMVGGPCDGVEMVVVAWSPDAADLKRLNEGSPIFLSIIGGLPPHFLSTSPPPAQQEDEKPTP